MTARARQRMGWGVLLGGFVLAVVVPAVLLVPGSSSQQGGVIRYVNNADPTCGGQTPCYASIQAAVNAVQAGDTIQIQAGMYVEQVLIAGKNATATAESSRIVLQADPAAPVGSVVLQGAVTQCTQGYAIQLQQSRFITIRGLTVTGAGGQAISLLGGNNQNGAVHIERNRIVGNGSASCDGGITIARGNPGTLIVNNVISGNGRNGLATIDADGGPHAVVGNTIVGNGWNGVSATRQHVLLLVNNAITGNGVATGSTGGRVGVKREPSSLPLPIGIMLLNNLLCGNRLGELEGPILDGTDSGNLTPTGTEGPGVAASPGCENPATVYARLAGPDGILNTLDDDPTPAAGSPLIDRGLDPRTQFTPDLNPLVEADFFAPAIRPRAGTPGGPALFDIGAVEAQVDTQAPAVSVLQPAATAHLRQTVTVEAQATDAGSGVASLTLQADSQSLTATLNPTLPPPAASVTATASWNTTTVADGTHTLTATATDQATNPASAQRVVIVDNTPPDTAISTGPIGEITSSSATVTYTGTDNLTPVGSLLFAWRFDGGTYTSFSAATTATLTGLTEGPHSVDVKARDLAGNEDPTPATRLFTVRFGPSLSTLDPATGPIGTLVTLTGARFAPGSTQVAFNGVAAVIRTITATTLTTTVPIGATTGPVTVTTAQGTASQPFTVTTTGDLGLTVDPPSVPAVQGMSVTVRVGAPATGSVTGLVTLGTGPLPPGVTARFSSPMLAPNATAMLTLTTTDSTPVGAHPIAVQGTAQIDGSPVTRTGATSLEVLASGQTMLAAQVRDGSDVPLAGVRFSLGGAAITPLGLSDAGGNVLVPLGGMTGPHVFLIDGSSLDSPTAFYPTVPVTVEIQPGVVNLLGFVPKLRAHPAAKLMPMPPGQAVVVTDPELPGFTMTIPAGVRIIGWDGQPNSQVAVVAVPPDGTPLPPLVVGPGQRAGPIYLFSFGKVGGGIPTGNVVIDTANDLGALPGEPIGLYYFNEAPDGTAPNRWEQYGTGTVSPDGTRIVTDRNPATGQPYGMPRFCCGARGNVSLGQPSLSDQVRSRNAKGGEPVDLSTGRFTVQKTDLVLPGRLAVVVERTYRSENSRTGLLGVGWNLAPWESTLSQSGSGYLLTLADQSSYLLSATGPGRWENQTEPFLRGAVLSAVGAGFALRRKDGTVQRFDPIVGVANLWGLATVSDRHGNTVTVTRVAGRVGTTLGLRIASVTEPAGRSLVFSYDSLGRVAFLTDPLGRQVRYSYDPAGRVETVMDPAGGVTRYTYDASHRILTITDPRGISFLSNEYDANGRVSRQTQADGGVWTFAYTLTGNTVTQTVLTDPRGNPTTYRFNTAGFTLSQTDALGQTTVNEYAPGSNLLLSTTDPLGRVTRFTYDTQGNVTQVTDPAGNVRSFTYEPTFNRVTSLTDPLSQVTRFEYDAQGNLTAIVDPLSNRTTLAYNAAGQVTSTTDPLNQTTTFSYDSAGNLATVADPLGNTTRRSYDAASRLIQQIDPRGMPTNVAYNALNQPTQIGDPQGGLTRFSYDGNGNLLTVTDARSNTTSHTYDSMDRLQTRTDPVSATEGFEYDGLGNLTRHTDRKGQVATFSYDGLNRRTGATYADGSATTLGYDAGGRLTGASDSVGGALLNGYDGLDRLIAQTTALGTVRYQYDALGRRTQLDAPNQASVGYGYDAASRLRTISQAPLGPATLDYDALGRRTRLSLPNGVSTEYQYDATSRLTALSYRTATGQLGDLTYQYDPAGNRTRVGGAFSRTLVPTAVPAASYNAANRQLAFGSQTLAYDPNGNLTSDGVTLYTWSARNQLLAITGAGLTATFSYDALGRRQSRSVNGASTQFLYDGLTPIQEAGTSGIATLLTGLGIDEYLTRADAAGARTLLTDALGSTVALTDSAGVVQTQYSYEPFGATAVTGPADANPFQYTGRENDGTGLYYYRARYYHPTLQRFLSGDPIGFTSGDPNLYAYVTNNPLRFVDPLGFINVLVGGGISVILPGGGEASGGFVVNPGLFGQQADVGLFGSAGLGAGLNVSGDIFVGLVEGGVENVQGRTVNLNLTFGPPIPIPISVSVFTDPATGDIVGGTVGWGPSATPIGASGTVAVTGTATVRDALRALSRLLSGKSSAPRGETQKNSMVGRK